MTEQNGHEEREPNSVRDGDAGFAALDATEPHFGSSALQGSAFESSDFSASVSFEPVAPPVEVGGFEALSFEAPAALAEPTLSWETPQDTSAVLEPVPAVPQAVEPSYPEMPPSLEEPPYEDEPPYSEEPPYLDEPPYPEAEYAGEYWVLSDEAAPAEAEKPAPTELAPTQKAQQPEKPAPKKWVRNKAAEQIAVEEFPDWHPAAHGFVEESIARDNGGDYAGEFRVPELPLQAVPANSEGGSSEEDGKSPRRSLLVDPNLPAVSIDEAPVRAFMPGGAEPRPMAAGRMSRAGAASIGSGLTAEEKDEIERQAAQRDKQKKRKSSRASKNTDYKRGFRRMSAAQEEKMRSRSPYAPAFGARSDDEETRKSPTRRGSGSNLFREGSALNEELTPAEEALIRGIAEEEAQGGGTVLLTRGSVALEMGLPVLAVVAHAQTFSDGAHTSIPAPGLGALAVARGGRNSVIARNLAELGVGIDDVAFVSKHDTSTNANDPNESDLHTRVGMALGRTPGNPLLVISQKTLTGHAKGGACVFQVGGIIDVFRTGLIPANVALDCVDDAMEQYGPLVWLRSPLNLSSRGPVRAAFATSLGFGHVSGFLALVNPAAFEAIVEREVGRERLEAWRAASDRRLRNGQRHIEMGMLGHAPLFTSVEGRRLPDDPAAGIAGDAHEVEAAILLDPNARLGADGFYHLPEGK